MYFKFWRREGPSIWSDLIRALDIKCAIYRFDFAPEGFLGLIPMRGRGWVDGESVNRWREKKKWVWSLPEEKDGGEREERDGQYTCHVSIGI